MEFASLSPAEQIVQLINRLYRTQLTTTSGGNLSVMDRDGVLWITPSGIDKGSLTPEDIIQVLPDGSFRGPHKPSVEHPFHLAVYRARPDIRAIVHAHPPTLVAFSLIRENPLPDLTPTCRELCSEIGSAGFGIPGSDTLVRCVLDAFRRGCGTVMMDNHGAVVGDADLLSAFLRFEALDFTARTEIHARTLTGGELPRRLSDADFAHWTRAAEAVLPETFAPAAPGAEERELRQQMCALIRRAYSNNLITGAQGIFSCRLSCGDFLITPDGGDRLSLEAEDMVLIRGGKAEAGKSVPAAFRLHGAIYARSPEIRSVIQAEPPHIMSFAVTDVPFDAKLIPESYIMLKNVRKFPFGWASVYAERLAEALSVKEPAAIVENECVLSCGVSPINAFDRLEVMEYTARSVVDTVRIRRQIVPITPDEIRNMEVTFHL